MTGSYGQNRLSVMRSCQTVFQSGCTILNWMRLLHAPHPHQDTVGSVSWILAILVGVQWYLIFAFICISLMIGEVEYLFIGLFVICTSSLVTAFIKKKQCVPLCRKAIVGGTWGAPGQVSLDLVLLWICYLQAVDMMQDPAFLNLIFIGCTCKILLACFDVAMHLICCIWKLHLKNAYVTDRQWLQWGMGGTW